MRTAVFFTSSAERWAKARTSSATTGSPHLLPLLGQLRRRHLELAGWFGRQFHRWHQPPAQCARWQTNIANRLEKDFHLTGNFFGNAAGFFLALAGCTWASGQGRQLGAWSAFCCVPAESCSMAALVCCKLALGHWHPEQGFATHWKPVLKPKRFDQPQLPNGQRQHS